MYQPGTVVAVKVRHPGVTLLMEQDFTLMQRAANFSTQVPVLADLKLDESVRQFGAPLKEQLDLQVGFCSIRFLQSCRADCDTAMGPVQQLLHRRRS